MAIDFGRAARGVATGYLQAKIRNTEANDQLKANVLERAGANYFNEVLPEVTQLEKNRKVSYDRIKTEFGPNAAELADINNIITGDGKGYDNFKELMKTNELNREKLDAVTFEGDYNTRFNQRGMDFQEKYQGIFDQIGIKQAGGLGPYTVENQLKEEKQKPPMSMMTTKDQMTDTVQPVKPEFGSTQLEEYITPLAGDEFTQKSEYRLRNNSAINNAITVAGLKAKISQDDFGNISVTAVDEADQIKLDFVTSETNSRFAKGYKRLDFNNIGSEAVAFVNSVDRATVGFKAETDETFKMLNLVANAKLANSIEKSITLEDGRKITPFELFVNKNNALLETYMNSGIQARRFIKKKYNALVPNDSGYYEFFKLIDIDLDKQEGS
jgi:hypothetical protein